MKRKVIHMYQKLRSRLDHKDDSGFTLIELLMVIVILAVLAAVVVFSVGGLNDTSKASACKAELSTVNTAAESYYAQFKTAAAGPQDLIAKGVLHDDADIDAGTATSFVSNTITFTWYASGASVPTTPAHNAGTAGELYAVCP